MYPYAFILPPHIAIRKSFLIQHFLGQQHLPNRNMIGLERWEVVWNIKWLQTMKRGERFGYISMRTPFNSDVFEFNSIKFRRWRIAMNNILLTCQDIGLIHVLLHTLCYFTVSYFQCKIWFLSNVPKKLLYIPLAIARHNSS